MQSTSIILQLFIGSLYLAVNLILLYIFLTPRRSRLFQAAALIITSLVVYYLCYPYNDLLNPRFLLRDYIFGTLFFIPCVLIFKESLQAKIFIFFMNYSLTQLTFLIFIYLDQFIKTGIPQLCIMIGLSLELAALPFINRCFKAPVRDIIRTLSSQYPVFTLFPILSFLLLAYYALQGNFTLSTFITLVLSTMLIFFTYYLMSVSIRATRRQHELEVISNTDSLTGICNRRHIERRLKEEFKRYQKTGIEFAVIMSDIDFFKNINDRYGHDCGDKILIEIVKDINRAVRSNDTVARWGGEEFIILLPATNGEHALSSAERIRKIISENRYDCSGDLIPVTLTLGVSVAVPDESMADMIKRADAALYCGKQKGRNCVVMSDDVYHEIKDSIV
ncbi:MAG TPA: GGDEF domain-containing protein [Spirochaetota bacterium]|nr:GGDEF domain-containing protein [Spirochaetota bacterium]HRX49124.1 GGDEF domain-containing protein [Spirochaetota bacterium]